MVIMIILLMLCLPLILMLSLYTTTEVVSIVVDVPVNGIDVVVEELVELDLDKGESFTVDYVISPTEAANKSVEFYFLALGDDKLADFTVDGNTITPTSAGSARVAVETQDGGYRDYFDVVVYSKRVESISSEPEKSTLTVGETTKIKTSYYPTVVKDEGLSYRVKEGEGIVTVSQAGVIRAVGIGTAVIEVTSNDNPTARSELTVTVESSGIIDFVSDRCDITALDDVAYITSVISPDITLRDYSIELFILESGEAVAENIALAELDTESGILCCRFIDTAFVGNIEIRLTVNTTGGESVTKSAYVYRISEIMIGWADGSDKDYDVFNSNSDGERIEINVRPLGADLTYFITLEYTAITGVVGNVTSGGAFELAEGLRYVADGGFISVELECSSEGVFLIVRGEYSPTLDDLKNNVTVTGISLTVLNNHDGTTTVLDSISVVVY